MATGIGLGSFKPKASKTAENLLTPVLQGEHKKEERIQLRISQDVFLLFKDVCDKNKVSMSEALRSYINTVISGGKL